ncbi:hypothetical protein Tco_0200658, partial [Tanacetum coccineum]
LELRLEVCLIIVEQLLLQLHSSGWQDEGGISTFVVMGTSTREVDSLFRLRIESIHVYGLGLSMLEMKPDDTEELCC